MNRRTFLPALGVSLGLAACGGGEASPDAGPPDANPTCIEAEQHSDLAWIQEKIFSPSCASFASCHQNAALSAAELNLEDGNAEGNMVGVPSTLFPQYDLVEPGDPENSYLMIILGQYDGPLTEKGTMPFNSPLLCKEKRDAIERWIEALPTTE